VATLLGGALNPLRSGVLPVVLSSSGTGSIVSNFNGTAIPAGDSVWFSSVVKVSGLGSSPVRVFLRAGTVQFTAAGQTYNVATPDATITFSPSTTTATTVYDPSRIEWITTVPSSGLAGNVFLSGFSFAVPASGLPGGINPVTWSGTFYSDTAGVSINWQWAAAAYTSFAVDNRSLGVKPVDDNSASQYKNSDHAGTPESYKSFVTGGARGGGGSNYTGSYSGTASVTPIDQVPNYPPVANAGPNQSVQVTNTVQLDGTASSDRDGDPLTYRWSLVSVPAGSSTVLNGANTARPTFNVDRPGTFIAQLIVNDGFVDSSPATVTIATVNSPPVANAGANQTVFVGSTVHLNGSGSTDVDGDPLTYHWSLTSVPGGSTAQLSSPTTVNPTFTADITGTYVVQLVVNDGQVNSPPVTVAITTVNSPPVANAGPDQTIQAGHTVNLDGSKSSDVDGDPLTYRWSIISQPAGSGASLSNATSSSPSFVADKAGTFVVQLIVNDGFVDSTPATVNITSQNAAPVANAGPNQSVFVGSTVTLNGSGSTDVDGDSITYRWSLLSIPAASIARLSNPTSVNPTFVADVKGTYVAQLIVNDGFVDSAPSTVTISTLNSPPVANAGPAQTVVAGNTVQLNGSGSTDVDGDPLTFRWAILSKPANSTAVLSNASAVAPSFFADQVGSYVVQLIVNDGTVDGAPSTATITTQDAPPIANAGPAQTVPLGTVVTLDGSKSSDPDGQSVIYLWSLLSTPAGSHAALANPTSANPTFTADVAGNYVAQLVVNDGFGNSAPSTVMVSTINSIPVANAGTNQTVKLGTTVQLDGSGSSDADHDPLTYRWSITVRPGGSSATLSDPTAVKPTFVADVSGTYLAQLIVNDGKVDSSPATVMIVAQAIPSLTLSAPTGLTALPGQAVPVSFLVSNTGSSDAQQAVLSQGAATFPLGTVPAGQSHTAVVNFPIPGISAKGTSETDAAYLARLQASDNVTFSVPASLTWSDIFGDSLGPVSAAASITEQVPVVNIALSAPATAQAGDTVTYTLTLTNSGHATGVINNLLITLPDQSTQTLTPTQTSLSAGATASATVQFHVPATQRTSISATAQVAWLDAAANTYGPVSSTAATQINGVSPPVLASCLPAGSLSALVKDGKVTSYVPNGFWNGSATGIRVVPVEGGGAPSLVATPGVVNSCASNSVTGQTVCTSNNTDVYLLTDSTLTNTLKSGGTGTVQLSGGTCQTCGVAINAGTNQAVLSVALAAPNTSGIQLLDLTTNSLSAPVPTSGVHISEDISVDPTRNFILSASEESVFEIFQPGNSGTQLFDQRIGSPTFLQYQMDATAEDCSTGIALGSIERAFNSFGQQVGGGTFVLADLSQATFVPGSPGSWSAPGQVQQVGELSGLPEFAVAPGSHLGVAAGENGVSTVGAFRLPSTSGSGVPAILDWVSAIIPNPGEPNGDFNFQTGNEPHTVTAYVSPTTGKAYGVIADDGNGFEQGDSNFLAVVDLEALLDAPRNSTAHQVDSSVDLVASGIIRFVPTHTFLTFPASPKLGAQGAQNFAVNIQGADTHFVQGTTTVNLGAGVSVAAVTVNSPTNLTATVNIDPLATIGFRSVTVTTGAEALSMRAGGFNIDKGPAAISQIAPSSGAQGQSMTVTITGQSTHFAQGVTTADFQFVSGGGSSISNFIVNSPTSITATLNIGPLETITQHTVTITTEGEILQSSFTVNAGPAKLTNASPFGGPQGMQHITVNITGQLTHFSRTSSLLVDGSLQVQGFTVASPTTATAELGISSSATVGAHNFSVQTQGELASLAGAFNVTPGVPTLTFLGSHSGFQATQNNTTIVDGAFTHFVQGVSVPNFGPGVTIVSFTVSSPTSASATFSVDPLAPLGTRNVSVTTGSEVATMITGFTVNPGSAAVLSFSPATVAQGQQNIAVALTGTSTHFAQGLSTAGFGSGITVKSLTVNSPTSATAVVSIDPAATGLRPIVVSTAGEVANSFSQLTISTGTPTLTQLSPASAQPGTQNISVAISGLATHFAQGTSVASFGTGITVASLTVNSPVSATAVVNIAPGAALGTRTVTVTTGSEVAAFNNGFAVAPAPPAVSTNLTEGMEITTLTPIVGSVNSGTWTLSYALASADGTGPAPVFVPFASGTTAVSNGLLGTLDPTLLLNGNYIIQLASTDQFGQISTISTNVEVSRNTKVGNFTLSFADMNVPAPGLPVTVTRTYDSRDKASHDFGVGWTLSLVNLRLQKNGTLGSGWQMVQNGTGLSVSFCLAEIKPHFVTITFPDGRVYKFQATTQPQCQLTPIEFANLTFVQVPGPTGTQGASLQIVGDNNVAVDPPTAGVVDLIDLSTSADSNPTVFQLTTAEGFTYVIDQTLGATSVADPNGNRLTINASGITSSAGQSVAFIRDAQGRITQIADALGNVLTYSYSGTGDLSTFVDRVGNTTTYSYDTTHLLTNIVAPNGEQAVKNVYDAQGRLVSTTDASGKTVNYTHALASNQEAVQDRLGNTTTYTYDQDGNITQTVDALGNVTSATYDSNDDQLTSTNALGKTTTYVYDPLGNRTSETDPLGNKTSYTYNSFKQPLTITDPLGNVTTNTYDSKGNLLTTQDALGNTTTYTNNALGQPLTLKDALGNTTSFVYTNGNLTQQTDALGNVSNFTYDANNNKLTQAVTRTRADGTKETLTTQYQYDANNRLTKTINPDATATQMVYNSIGKQSDVFDALNHKTHFDYDNNGRLVTTTYADGKTESVTYDANDRRLTSTDRAGHVTSYNYDAVGRLTKTTFADNSTTQTVYDAAGQTIQTIDGLNNTTAYAYDDAGRRTSITDALSNVTSFSYDAAGNQLSMTDALKHTTKFVYDTDNRRVQALYNDTTTDSVGYDAVGRQTSKTDQAGKVTQFGYDAVGRLTSVTKLCSTAVPGCGPATTSYAYDEVGNRITQTDANGHVTSFAYDQLGRRVSRTLPLGMSESYGYDADGNLTSKKDFNSHTTNYAYDTMNRLLSKTADAFFSSGACAGGVCGATKVSFTYTATGRRLTMTDAAGSTSYTYDTRDRLLTKASPFGTLTYTYDAAGNTLSLVSSNSGGASMTYGYDQLNRLSSVTDASGVTNYSYDAVGNLSGYTYPNGVATSYTYDTLNRLTNMQSTCGAAAPGCGAPGTPISSYVYTLGAAGNRLSVAELSGRTVNYGYDDLYRLTSETVASDPHGNNGQVSYTFDNVGNRLQRTSTLPGVVSTGLLNYDANDRTATDPYDAGGNLLSSGAGANVYDFENRLVQAGGVKLVYDGDGNRVKETVATVTTSYLVADQNLTGYAQVLDELQSGSVSRTYSYGLSLISQKLGASISQLSFYGFDGHGSVRFLSSSTGSVTDTYDYDAFGILTSHTGTTANNYLFAGEQFDPALGIYYNRARYYDQRLGRFWSIDAWEGDPESPASLHKYLYTSTNPVNRIDPTGNDDLLDVAISLAVATIENAITFLAVGQLNYVLTNRMLRGNLLHKYISQFYRAWGFKTNRWIGTNANPPINRFRPDIWFPWAGSVFTGEIYEIKSSDPGEIAHGLLDLTFYQSELQAHSPGINWHPGSYLLVIPPILRIPEFPFIRFAIKLEQPGLITYTPTPDTERALEAGGIAALLQIFFLMEEDVPVPSDVPGNGPTPQPGPEPMPQPQPKPPLAA
jgi:RHS repeat-associated protein